MYIIISIQNAGHELVLWSTRSNFTRFFFTFSLFINLFYIFFYLFFTITVTPYPRTVSGSRNWSGWFWTCPVAEAWSTESSRLGLIAMPDIEFISAFLLYRLAPNKHSFSNELASNFNSSSFNMSACVWSFCYWWL